MRIGVDIDGVLNDFYGFLVDYGTKYSVEHGVSGMQNPKGRNQVELYGWDRETGRDFRVEYGIIETSRIPARVFAKEVLDKLQGEGDEILIATGRSNSDTAVRGMGGKTWEEITLEWLKRNGIVYDRIVFGLENKAEFCAQAEVDVMIEDSPNFLQDFTGETDVLVYAAPYNEEFDSEKMVRVYSWYEIYAKISELKEVR